ncbi:MAG: aldo/keto reductase [Gammaproteobacteria bacterium]|nr:aldo/keto reductase [Gammaproteobacteria bacterium]
MHYRLLGPTGLYVSEICLGTMTYGVGSEGIWGSIAGLDEDAVVAQVRTAFDAGVNFIDTANVYSNGQSERLLGAALKRLGLPRDELVIATKATGVMGDAPNACGQSRHHLFHAVEASLQRLRLDHIDLYQLHGFDPLTPLEESLAALDDLVRSGRVRYIGLCNMAAWQVMKSLAISERRNLARMASVQAYYTIAGRDLEREIVPLINDQRLGLMVWSPLAGGLLTGKFQPDGAGPEGARRSTFDFPVVDRPRAFRCVEAMRSVAARHGASVAQIALAWLLAKPWVTSVIIGAKTQAQLEDNLGSSAVRLDAEDLAALDAAGELPPEYPGWMIERQSRYRRSTPTRG